MGDPAPYPACGGGARMTDDQLVNAAMDEWRKLLSADASQTTDYERIETQQDVAGKNHLAAISPKVTTDMGLKRLRKELTRLRQENQSPVQESSQEEEEDPHQVVSQSSDSASAVSRIQRGPMDRGQSATRLRAILSCPSIVRNEEILLPFLRADRLHAEKAANRLLEYYLLTMELFGDDLLTRPILLNDLSRHEKKLLDSGWIQLLLTRDTAGRRIMTLDEVGPPDPSNILSKVRTESQFTYQTNIVTPTPPPLT